jgi:hypothetical protein
MKRYFIGMLAGAAVVMAVGYAVIAVRHHRAASPRAGMTLTQRIAQAREEFDAQMTKSANDTTLLPEVRVDALAAKTKADALFALDARLGTRETEVYAQQESEHWQRLSEALRHPQPKAREPWQIEWKKSSDISLEETANDPRFGPASRADAVASKQKFDALFAIDTLLGTDETDIFLRQETDRSRRTVSAMEALKK